ncbi:hypothetical protein FIBSPDRAFT_137237 [Athelia psychrophila]|uniref:Uncharacterized protein n=1 Tax=Athelia psychrophila TaxID=1759441 RepID=A0A166C5H9_9AGAM|nr:hypothetical protein FIBSPDRAFT_137237 [Fibularhizoctonia sp. CBS 109695]
MSHHIHKQTISDAGHNAPGVHVHDCVGTFSFSPLLSSLPPITPWLNFDSPCDAGACYSKLTSISPPSSMTLHPSSNKPGPPRTSMLISMAIIAGESSSLSTTLRHHRRRPRSPRRASPRAAKTTTRWATPPSLKESNLLQKPLSAQHSSFPHGFLPLPRQLFGPLPRRRASHPALARRAQLPEAELPSLGLRQPCLYCLLPLPG